jgi:hypothetical protein
MGETPMPLFMRAIVVSLLIAVLMGCRSDPAVRGGVRFLEQSQQPEGFWGTGTHTTGFEVYHMIPGSHDAFRVGTTALCIMALREAGETKAHDKAVEWLLNHGEARRDDGSILYNIWAHIYATQALAIEMRHNTDPRIAKAAQWHIDQMAKYASYAGGWNYYDFDAHTEMDSMGATSFGTAAGLIAFYEARKSGLDVPQRLLDLSVHRLEEARLPNGVYLYGVDYKYLPRLPANMGRGAVGRTEPANLALLLWHSDKVTKSDAIDGLALFWREHATLEMGRKRPEPHQSWYQTSGYYFYFDHYYAAELIAMLHRSSDAQKMREVIKSHQEPDGSWWDFPMWDYHKPYGTAFAVLTLLKCDQVLTHHPPSPGNPGEGRGEGSSVHEATRP